VVHGLRSLRDTLQQENTLTADNCTLGFVGVDANFTIVEGDDLKRLHSINLRYLDMINDAPPADGDVAMA
jgi:hypothetical protein